MPEYKVSCPSCKTVLKSAQPLPPGKKIKCPKCQQVFATAPAAPAPPPVEEIQPAAAAAARPRRPAREPEDDDTVPLRRGKPAPRDEYEDEPPRRKPAPPRDDYDDEPEPPRRKPAPPPRDDYDDEPEPPRRKPAPRDDYDDEEPPRRKPAPRDDYGDEEPEPRRKGRPADEDEEAEPARGRGARADDGDDFDGERRPPGKKKNLGMIMACVGGGSFVGMFIFMWLAFFFAASAISGQFQNMQMQFQQGGKGLNINPPKGFEDMLQNMPKDAPKIDPKELDDAFKKAFDKLKGQKKTSKANDAIPGDTSPVGQPVNVDSKINKAAYDQIQLGTRLSQIEQQLGPRTLYKAGDMPKVKQPEAERKAFLDAYKKVNLIFQWRDGKHQLFVGFVYGENGQDDVAVFKAYFYPEGGQTRVAYQADNSAAPKSK